MILRSPVVVVMSSRTPANMPEERGVAYYIVVPPTATSSSNGDENKSASETSSDDSSRRATSPSSVATATINCCIGVKRYGGLYCQHCEISLLQEGEESARYAGKVHYEKCPLCDANIVDGPGEIATPSVVNGGDATLDVTSPVGECMCFDWMMAPHRLDQRKFRNRTVVDSYGTAFDVAFFLEKIVGACPVQFYDKIERKE